MQSETSRALTGAERALEEWGRSPRVVLEVLDRGVELCELALEGHAESGRDAVDDFVEDVERVRNGAAGEARTTLAGIERMVGELFGGPDDEVETRARRCRVYVLLAKVQLMRDLVAAVDEESLAVMLADHGGQAPAPGGFVEVAEDGEDGGSEDGGSEDGDAGTAPAPACQMQ